MREISIVFIILFQLSCFAQQNDERPYLVVLSMDGFRWDYADSFPTPNLHYIIQNGAHAKSMIPIFPSVTFPNHYTIATGLYPDYHGIVNNTFYDPDLKLEYNYNDAKIVGDSRFYNGEPIWVTARKQKIISACYFWPGSEAEINGMRPTYWKKYNPSIPYEQRTDTVVHWLSLPEYKRPHLLMFYFDNPDHLTHSEGPFGTDVQKMIMRLDTLIGIFMNKLKQIQIYNEVNFIIVSDHGMSAINNSKIIYLDPLIKKEWCEHINGHYSLITMDVKPGYSDSLFNVLLKIKHLKVWRKEELPKRFHYGLNQRIGEFVLLADSAYSMTWTDEKITMNGNHGYDNVNTDMHGIFYAIGPAFKKGYSQPSFENVHLYSLMAYILKITPSKNNGDFEQVKDMLK
jgi:alkaline phosphatase D